jgi:hypothetical protein
LPINTIATTAATGLLEQELRIEKHADGHEEQNRKRVAHRQRFGRGSQRKVGARDDQARHERPEGHGRAE